MRGWGMRTNTGGWAGGVYSVQCFLSRTTTSWSRSHPDHHFSGRPGLLMLTPPPKVSVITTQRTQANWLAGPQNGHGNASNPYKTL